jgi:hypothetical protein
MENDKIFDPVRKKWLIATPEELIRQHWINLLHIEDGYPFSFLSVEKKFKVHKLEKRYDIVAYNHLSEPYILIECKSESTKIHQKYFEQAAIYNIAIKAPYLVITNGIQTFIAHIDFSLGSYTFIQNIPKFKDL